jgi:HEAT repeat protein
MFRTRFFLTVLAAGLLIAAAAAPVWAQQTPPIQGDSQQLIAILQKADAPLFDKAKACQALAVIGKKDAIPVLAGLLSNPELAHYARFGLETIPDPSVDDTLRDAAGKLQGQLLVGVLSSIGSRRDAKAVGLLTAKLGDSDRAVATAAAISLGRIASPEAVAVLEKALAGSPEIRTAVAGACLTAADVLLTQGKKAESAAIYDVLRKADVVKYIQLAAIEGAIRARGPEGLALLAESLRSDDPQVFRAGLHAAQQLRGPDAATALIAELKLSESVNPYPRQTLLIYALGDLGEKAALPIVLKAAQSPARDIRQAAIHVLGTLGDEQAVPVLLATAIDEGSGLASVAQQSLVELEGDGIDAALTAQLAQSKGKALAVIIDLVGQRNVTSAVPTLIQAADDADMAVRDAAIQALGRTVGPDQLALLIGRVVTPKAGDTAGVAKEALRTACIRMPDRDVAAGKLLAAIPQASGEAKTSLFELVGVVGGTKALEGAREAARSENDETKDAATRVLGAWMSADAAPVLLDLAKTETSNKYKVRALRGYIRIARQLDMEPKQRMEMCRQAIEVAQRADEKRLAIEVLSRVHSAQALAQVVPYLQDASVKEAASDTAIKISDKIIQGAPKAVADAMKQVIAATGNKDLATRAKNLLALAEKKLSSK